MKKTVFIIVFTSLFLLVSIQPSVSWNNDHITGWGTADNPGYGTHDWIAEEAYRLLPTATRGWLTDNLAVFLWGTSAPDNLGGSYEGVGGYQDTGKHHNYYNIDGTFVTDEDDASTRAQEEYDKAFAELQNDNLDLAAYYAGAMTHYIADMAVWGHVMTGEVIHSYFEDDVEGTIIADYFNASASDRTSNTFTITFDGTLEDISAYNAAKEMGWDTFNDSGGTHNYQWMDSNYPGLTDGNPGSDAWYGQADTWPEGEFKDRVTESINLAVNYIAAVLNKLTTESGVSEGDFLTLSFISVFTVMIIAIVVITRSRNRRGDSIE
ncbi:MAG: zinc dependent phospholipase C family protein [Candidatus Hodarchaeota archaeon]